MIILSVDIFWFKELLELFKRILTQKNVSSDLFFSGLADDVKETVIFCWILIRAMHVILNRQKRRLLIVFNFAFIFGFENTENFFGEQLFLADVTLGQHLLLFHF